MAELKAVTPLAGMPPVTIGSVTLSELDLGMLTSVAPYRGQEKRLSAALKELHGIAWPAAGRATGKAGTRAIWFGRDMALIAGPVPDASLSKHAALTDQSDAWAAVELSGPGVEDVLARCVPVDLSQAGFKRGHTARTLLQHMNASITRTGTETFLILVFRSMAGTLKHDLQTAMAGVAGRAAIG